MGMDQAKRLKSLEAKNARLKRVVADLSLDNQILRDMLPRETFKHGEQVPKRHPCTATIRCIRAPSVQS